MPDTPFDGPKDPSFPPGTGGGGSGSAPLIVLGPRMRQIANMLGGDFKAAFLGMLDQLQRSSKFSDLFSGFGSKGGKGEKLVIGEDRLRQLFDSGLLTGKGNIALFDQFFSALAGTGDTGTGDGGAGGGSDIFDGGTGGGNFGGFELPEFPSVDPAVIAGLTNSILELLENPGFPEEILQGARNRARGEGKNATRDAILRRGDDFSARGLFGSGLQTRDIERIETQGRRSIQDALAQIDFANAQQSLGSISTAFQGVNTLNSLGATEFGGVLDALQLALSRDLGLRGLDLQELQLLSNNALQELLNSLLLGQFPGFGGSTSTPAFSGGGSGVNSDGSGFAV